MIHKFFIIHGSGGSPEENWIPWLTEQLHQSGAEVITPQFPFGEHENFEEWRAVFQQYESKLDENTVMIGHSIGVPFVLRIMEEKEVAGCILVSGMNRVIEESEYKNVQAKFVHDFDWRRIRANCPRAAVLHGEDDPYVPAACAEEIAEQLETDPIIIPGGKHLNTSAGYAQFPALLEEALPYLME